MFSYATGSRNVGHFNRDRFSNFVSELNRALPQHTQRYTPTPWKSQYLPEYAGSVPFLRVTENCSGVRISFQSASLLTVLSCIDDLFAGSEGEVLYGAA
jgi:hypothetical protein